MRNLPAVLPDPDVLLPVFAFRIPVKMQPYAYKDLIVGTALDVVYANKDVFYSVRHGDPLCGCSVALSNQGICRKWLILRCRPVYLVRTGFFRTFHGDIYNIKLIILQFPDFAVFNMIAI